MNTYRAGIFAPFKAHNASCAKQFRAEAGRPTYSPLTLRMSAQRSTQESRGICAFCMLSDDLRRISPECRKRPPVPHVSLLPRIGDYVRSEQKECILFGRVIEIHGPDSADLNEIGTRMLLMNACFVFLREGATGRPNAQESRFDRGFCDSATAQVIAECEFTSTKAGHGAEVSLRQRQQADASMLAQGILPLD